MSSSTAVWFDTTVALATASALLYTAGWSYASHWYGCFDIGIVGLGIPSEYQFVYGFWVLRRAWWVLVLLIGAVLLVWQGLRRRLRTLKTPALAIGIVLAFPLVFWGGSLVAHSDYRFHRENGFDQFPWARIWLKEKISTGNARVDQLTDDLAAAEYRLIVETPQSVYLIKPTTLSEPSILEIPWDGVQALRRLPSVPGGS